METKKRYSDEELEEFRTIVNDKLAIAKSDYDETMKILMNKNTNDVNDTSPTYKALEEGSSNRPKKSWFRWRNVSKSLSKRSKQHS